MKRLFAMTLALTMALSLCACGAGNNGSQTDLHHRWPKPRKSWHPPTSCWRMSRGPWSLTARWTARSAKRTKCTRALSRAARDLRKKPPRKSRLPERMIRNEHFRSNRAYPYKWHCGKAISVWKLCTIPLYSGQHKVFRGYFFKTSWNMDRCVL